MSVFASYSRRILVAAVGIGVLGAGLATSAYAAPAALPGVSDLPIPGLTRPVDASNGLLGISRGTIPGIATPDLQQVPVAGQILPDLEVVPLPQPEAPAGTAATEPTAADAAAADAPATDTPATDTTATDTTATDTTSPE